MEQHFLVKPFSECDPNVLRPFIGEQDSSSLSDYYAVFDSFKIVGVFNYILRSVEDKVDIVLNYHVSGSYLQRDRFKSFVNYLHQYLSRQYGECRYVVTAVDYCKDYPIVELLSSFGEVPNYDYDQDNELSGRSIYLKPVQPRR